MLHLSIAELIVATHDVLDKRGTALARVSSGAAYRKLLGAMLVQLEELSPALRGLPRAQLLKSFDVAHDHLVRALNVLRQLLAVWPNATPAMLEALRVLDEHFVGSSDGQLPYGKEVQLASVRAAKLDTYRPVLDAVPTPDGGTVTALVERYLEAGRELGESLSGRADDLAARRDMSQAAALRGRTIGLLGDLRISIRRDLEAEPTLPRSLEADILGYGDELERLAASRAASTATTTVTGSTDAATASPEEPPAPE